MSTTRKLIIAATALVLVAAVALGAFEEATKKITSSPKAIAALSQAIAKTLTPVATSYSLSETVSSGLENSVINATGAWDNHQQTGSLVINFPGAAAALGLGPIHIIVTPTVSYAKYGPAVESHFPTPWISLSSAQLASSTTTAQSSSPLSLVTALALHGSVVQDAGSATFSHHPARRYSVTLSADSGQTLLRSALTKMTPAERRSLGGSTAGFQAGHVDAYVNTAGYLVGLVESLSLSLQGQDVTVTTKETLSPLSSPITVTPPPSNQVTPASKIPGLNLG